MDHLWGEVETTQYRTTMACKDHHLGFDIIRYRKKRPNVHLPTSDAIIGAKSCSIVLAAMVVLDPYISYIYMMYGDLSI